MLIVFAACPISAPMSCGEGHIRAPDYATTSTACLVGAPPILVEWEKCHPTRKAMMDFYYVSKSRLEQHA